MTDGKVVILSLDDNQCAFFFTITTFNLVFDHAMCFEPRPNREQKFLMDWTPDTYLVWTSVGNNFALDIFFRNGSVAKTDIYKTSESFTCPSSGCRVVSSEVYSTGCYLFFYIDKVAFVDLDLSTFRLRHSDSRVGGVLSEIKRMSLDKAGNAYFVAWGPFCSTNDSEAVCFVLEILNNTR